MKILLFTITVLLSICAKAQKIDYSVVSVPEEAGIIFKQITTANDYVCCPQVKRSSKKLDWFTNRVINISPDGTRLAFLSFRNNTSNIFYKDLTKLGGAVQRTCRQTVLDFSFSPDGKYICFTEKNGDFTQIFTTDANSGYVCRQITSSFCDYSPTFDTKSEKIFFSRKERMGYSVWSYDMDAKFLSSFTLGYNPCTINGTSYILCARINSYGKSEIWKIDYSNGTEECIVSNIGKSFSSPTISPDGKWILMTGESVITNGNFVYRNTDIYICKMDGSDLRRLTFHAADDLSPVWSPDGNFIYFVSQRGSNEGIANIWSMRFNSEE